MGLLTCVEAPRRSAAFVDDILLTPYLIVGGRRIKPTAMVKDTAFGFFNPYYIAVLLVTPARRYTGATPSPNNPDSQQGGHQ